MLPSAKLDDPERLLSGALVGIADVPDGEPACQLRACTAVVPDLDNKSYSLSFTRLTVRANTFMPFRRSAPVEELGNALEPNADFLYPRGLLIGPEILTADGLDFGRRKAPRPANPALAEKVVRFAVEIPISH